MSKHLFNTDKADSGVLSGKAKYGGSEQGPNKSIQNELTYGSPKEISQPQNAEVNFSTDSPRREDITKPTETSRNDNLFKIKVRSDAPESALARLKASAIGGFYLNYLRKYSFLRQLAYKIWTTSYPLYSNYVAIYYSSPEVKCWRRLIKLEDYVNEAGIAKLQLQQKEWVETPIPKVYPVLRKDYLSSPHDGYHFPMVYVAAIANAKIYGGSNVVFSEKNAIHHDLYDFDRDYTSEELHGRHLVSTRKMKMRVLRFDSAPATMDSAASFVDSCSHNYAHWLTEVLPRIAVFCAESQFKQIPIIVDEGLHPNILESLYLTVGPERSVITIPIGRALEVRLLYVTSVAGYVPFQRRNTKLNGHSHGKFSPRALKRLTTLIPNISSNMPDKLFLKRNSGARKVTNADEIEKELVSRGFTVLEMEKLSFSEQLHFLSNAKKVVASSGAALANIIFCKAQTDIVIFISRHPDTSYWYWQNIAAASGMSVKYVLGESVTKDKGGIHADFYVALDDVEAAVFSGE